MHFSTYQEVLTYLYDNLPMFQRQGAAAFRKDLTKTLQLDVLMNSPHKAYKTIHIAGTNGKGSTAHMLSSILQKAGYKTGLYTSPHLRDFTERIKINGEQMKQDTVVSFINKNYNLIKNINPSFFEITSAMAFQYFNDEHVDIAVIETGMGGRLDSTNIINPVLSVITNVSYDHMQFLGNTLPEIAAEKAGIIKDGTPVVISEKQEEITKVFTDKAKDKSANIYFATDDYHIEKREEGFNISYKGTKWQEKVRLPLLGDYQKFNIAGVLKAIEVLVDNSVVKVSRRDIMDGLQEVITLTKLKGRYQIVRNNPKVIADVGHNQAGLKLVMEQLKKEKYEKLYFVIGVVNDKDLSKLWEILPKEAWFYFTQAEIPRALPAQQLFEAATKQGFKGELISSIPEAYNKALSVANENDLIFVGGSTFTVAEIEDLYNEN